MKAHRPEPSQRIKGLPALLRTTLSLTALTFMMTSLSTWLQASPVGATPEPGVTWSWYDYTNGVDDPGVYYAMGCGQAQGGDSAAFVILDFGAMYGDSGSQINLYNHVHTQTQVIQLAENYAWGFVNCNSRGDYLALAIGTNNSRVMDNTQGYQSAVTVNLFKEWVNTYAPRVSVWAANDIETWSNNNGPGPVYNWYDGYYPATSIPYLDFGSLDGCPESSGGSPNCAGGFQQGDYYNFSWRNPLAWPVPQIYVYGQAQEWYYMSLYGSGFDGTIEPWGPLDTYGTCSCGYTAPQAWAQLNQFFTSVMAYSFEMHNTGHQ